MSDLSTFLIGILCLLCGYVVGHVHALVSYHKRTTSERVVDMESKRAEFERARKSGARRTDHRYDPKQFRSDRHA